MSFQQYNVYDGLTACRVVAIANQSGTYLNGLLNNGVGATLTYATGVLTIDSVDIVVGDSVALIAQTNANENGIYVCTQTGAVGISAILTRRADFQCIEQIRIGQWTTIGAGTVSAGSMFVVVEPLPQRFGIDSLILTAAIPAGSGTASAKAASDNALPTVASVSGATVVNQMAVYADTAGTIKGDSNIAVDHPYTTSSATPGTIRAFTGDMNGTNATMTSGNLVGLRGSVTYVGASGGFLYGVQGKLLPSGTISGSSWNAGLFGQLDISAATVNAGQMAPIWGDYGASSGTLTDQTGLYGIAMTNTTAAVLQGQVYLYGGAQNLLLLNTNSGLSGVTYFKDSGTGSGSWGNATPPTPSKVLKITVDGAAYYLPLVDQNS